MPPPDKPDGTEAMAFEVILHKLTSVEQAMRAIPPLLHKIITQLEAQAKQPDVPVASYTQLYPQLQEGTAENDDVIEVAAAETSPPVPQDKRRRLWRWFTKEV